MSIKEIENYAKNLMTNSGHAFDHVKRVYDLCLNASKSMENIDYDSLLASALLHDIARSDEKKTGRCHAITGARWAKKYLASIGWKDESIEKISYCIKSHRYSKGIAPQSLEARVLQECDRFDGIGAVGIIRTVAHNYDIKAYHETDPLARNRELNDFTYGLDHFFAKILKLKDDLTIPWLKEKAEKRHEYMIFFLEKLENEIIRNDKNEAAIIIDEIRNSHGLNAYDIEFPFSSDKNTIVSRIMAHQNLNFVSGFLFQLKSEIL